jgi:hypothetical protein
MQRSGDFFTAGATVNLHFACRCVSTTCFGSLRIEHQRVASKLAPTFMPTSKLFTFLLLSGVTVFNISA